MDYDAENKIADLKRQQTIAPPQEPKQEEQSKIVETKEEPVKEKTGESEKEGPNPKNGDFTPDNIDIRKYFNFG